GRFGYWMIGMVPVRTVGWLMVPGLTPPEPSEPLVAFYRRVKPQGPGWQPVAQVAGVAVTEPLTRELTNWLLGCVLIYAALFGVGGLLLGGAWRGGLGVMGCG